MTTRTRRRNLPAAPPLLVAGAVLLMVGNIAHPIDADPTPLSRFDFATEATWIPIHFALAFGSLLLTAGVVAVARRTRGSRSESTAHFATTAALMGGTMLVIVFGALDGYAVSSLAASEAHTDTIRAAAIAEEAIDSGLAAMGTLSFFGLAVGALGLAILGDGRLQRWIGWAAVVIGAVGILAGATLLAQGPTSFAINVMLRPAAVAGTLWFIALGIALRRLDTSDPMGTRAPERDPTAAA